MMFILLFVSCAFAQWTPKESWKKNQWGVKESPEGQMDTGLDDPTVTLSRSPVGDWALDAPGLTMVGRGKPPTGEQLQTMLDKARASGSFQVGSVSGGIFGAHGGFGPSVGDSVGVVDGGGVSGVAG